MPWTAKDASHKTGHANTPKRKRLLAAIANKQLAAHGDEGRAIRVANAAVNRNYRKRGPKED